MPSVTHLSLILLVALVAFIGWNQWQHKPLNQSDEIVISINAAPRTLDPRFATDAISFRLAQLLFPAPVSFDEQGNPIPWVTRWQMLNPQHYRFQLQPQFQHLSIDDLISTYQSVLDKPLGSPHRGSLAHIQKIVRIDNHRVDFLLSKPDSLFPGLLVIGIIPQSAHSNSKKLNHYEGQGDFQLIHWDGEGDVHLSRKKDAQSFTFVVTKDPTIQALKMLHREVDIIPFGLTPEIASFLDQQEDLELIQRTGTTYAYIGINLEDTQLQATAIRQALAYAIDRQQIIDHLLQGKAELATSLMPAQHWSSNTHLQQYQPNLEKAKSLLAEHGYNQQNPLKLSFKSSKNTFRLRIAALLQQQLKQAHIDLDIQSYDWGTFYADVKAGRFQLYTLAWVGIKQPDIYRYVFHSEMIPPKGANRGRFNNQQVDALLDLADQRLSIPAKARAYKQMQQIVHHQLAYIPLWYEQQYAIVNQRIQNYQISADGNLLGLNNIRLD